MFYVGHPPCVTLGNRINPSRQNRSGSKSIGKHGGAGLISIILYNGLYFVFYMCKRAVNYRRERFICQYFYCQVIYFIICLCGCWFLQSSADVQNQCVMWEKMEQLEQSMALARHSHFQCESRGNVISWPSSCLCVLLDLSPVLLNLPFCFF